MKGVDENKLIRFANVPFFNEPSSAKLGVALDASIQLSSPQWPAIG